MAVLDYSVHVSQKEARIFEAPGKLLHRTHGQAMRDKDQASVRRILKENRELGFAQKQRWKRSMAFQYEKAAEIHQRRFSKLLCFSAVP